MNEIKCIDCRIPVGKSPHNFNVMVIFCFNCADLKERGIE